ncbi:MAG: hypothetical protein JXR90_02250 [Spirochaetes bacterium]|nr:hypothetical protein [Spirochaetota bacterium]
MKSQSDKVFITSIGSCTASGNTDDIFFNAKTKKSSLTVYNQITSDCPVKTVGKVKLKTDDIFAQKVRPFVSRNAELGAYAVSQCLNTIELSRTIPDGLIFGSASQGIDKIMEVIDDLKNNPFNTLNHNSISSITNAGVCRLLAERFSISGRVFAVEGASCSGMIAFIESFNAIKNKIASSMLAASGEANLFKPAFLFYNKKVRVNKETYTFFGKSGESIFRRPSEAVVPYSVPEKSDRGVIAEGGGALFLANENHTKEFDLPVFAEIENVFFYYNCTLSSNNDFLGLSNILNKLKNEIFDSIYLPISGCWATDYNLYTACSHYFPNTHCFTVEPVIGHTGAVSGLINIILGALSLKNSVLLPTLNFDAKNLDQNFKLKPSEDIIEKDIRRILVISSGWGGYNGACVLKKYNGK